MAIRDLTASLLKRMEEGTAQIYKRYEELIRASEKAYDVRAKTLETEYAAQANQASARAKIDLNNTLERMADSGYIHAGETVQAQIAANANRNNALNSLAVQKAKDRAELESEKAETSQQYALQAQKEASEYQAERLEEIRDQENRDREYAAAESQRAFENRLAQEKWSWEKAQKEKEEAEKAKEDEGFGEIVPEKSVYDYFDGIVKRNTKYKPDKGYKVIDRKAIQMALSDIVRDENLSLTYRYEMYLYAKSMGYLEE